jgi:hypothetical protein
MTTRQSQNASFFNKFLGRPPRGGASRGGRPDHPLHPHVAAVISLQGLEARAVTEADPQDEAAQNGQPPASGYTNIMVHAVDRR